MKKLLLIIFITGCCTTSNLRGYAPTDRYNMNHSLRYYRWIGPDQRPGIWVDIKTNKKVI
jgi:hypothetical protein